MSLRYGLVLGLMLMGGGSPQTEERPVSRYFENNQGAVLIEKLPNNKRNVAVQFWEQKGLRQIQYTLIDKGGDRVYEHGRECQMRGTLIKFMPDLDRSDQYQARRLDELTPKANEVRASVVENALADLSD